MLQQEMQRQQELLKKRGKISNLLFQTVRKVRRIDRVVQVDGVGGWVDCMSWGGWDRCGVWLFTPLIYHVQYALGKTYIHMYAHTYIYPTFHTNTHTPIHTHQHTTTPYTHQHTYTPIYTPQNTLIQDIEAAQAIRTREMTRFEQELRLQESKVHQTEAQVCACVLFVVHMHVLDVHMHVLDVHMHVLDVHMHVLDVHMHVLDVHMHVLDVHMHVLDVHMHVLDVHE